VQSGDAYVRKLGETESGDPTRIKPPGLGIVQFGENMRADWMHGGKLEAGHMFGNPGLRPQVDPVR
jgi:hypothetical protein